MAQIRLPYKRLIRLQSASKKHENALYIYRCDDGIRASRCKLAVIRQHSCALNVGGTALHGKRSETTEG